MSVWRNPDLVPAAISSWSPGPSTGLVEGFTAGRRAAKRNERFISERANLAEQIDRRIEAVHSLTGKRLDNPLKIGPVLDPGLRPPPVAAAEWIVRKLAGRALDRRLEGLKRDFPTADTGDLDERSRAFKTMPAGVLEFESAFDEAVKDLPEDVRASIPSHADMLAAIRAEAQEAEEAFADVAARGGGLTMLGGLAGSFEALIVEDPLNAMTLPIAAPVTLGRGGLIGGLKLAAAEGAINAGIEAVQQPQIQAYRQEQGLEGGLGRGAANIVLAGAGGAALTGLILGGAKTARLVVPAAKGTGALARKAGSALTRSERLAKFKTLVKKPTADQRAAALIIERDEHILASNPYPETAKGRTKHRQDLADTVDALQTGGPLLPDRKVELRAFDPRALKTDARTFQYKAAASAEGITDRLAHIKKWDNTKSGIVIVWERADGTLFIADGHQRLALAKRLLATDPDADIRLTGYVFREVDGHTADGVRVQAAAKNIAEGTGTAIDAARIIRVAPDVLDSLPVTDTLTRQARGLARLGDKAFGIVVNELVPPHYAAIAGRLIPHDGDLQRAVLEVLHKVQPENATQAESVIRQAMASGSRLVKQDSLFGEEIFQESLFLDRARVLDRSIKRLKRDKAVFGVLEREAADIEAAGNKLARGENIARIETAGQAADIIQVLAHRKGPVADALNRAARMAAEGHPKQAVDEFVAAITETIRSGEIRKLMGARGFEEPTARLDEPGGEEAARQAEALAAETRADDWGRNAEAADRAPEEIVLPIDPAATDAEKLAQIARLTEENEPLVARIMRRVDEELGTASTDRVKKPEGIKEKARRKDKLTARPWYRIEHVRDSYAFQTPILDYAAAIPRIVRILSDEGARLVKADMNLFRPDELGWRQVAFDLRMPNGQLVEYQLPFKEMLAVKKKGHDIYEIWRGKTSAQLAANAEELKLDMAESHALYTRAFNAALARLGLDETAARASWRSLSASFSSSTNKKLDMSSTATAPLRQRPDASRSRQGSPGAPGNETRPVSASAKTEFEKSLMDDTSSLNIGDLDESVEEIPIGVRIDEAGEARPVIASRQEILDELADDDDFLRKIGVCLL